MTVSVIIPSYKGENKIANILRALVEQTHKNFEVIVAIDGVTDRTESIALQFADRFQNLKIVTQPNRGRAAIRNFGAKNATGELLVFYDDDMIPFPDSVEEHKRGHHEHTDILITGNPQEYVEPHKTDIQNYKATIAGQWTTKYETRFAFLNEQNLFFTAANCSILKEVFEHLGGFDERLTDAEDYNLGWRALQSGKKVLFDKENKAIHQEFITANSYILRLRQYNNAHKKLDELHQVATVMSSNPSSFIRHFIYRFFAFPFWIEWIDRDVLSILPIRFRYKIYSMVFHALTKEYPNVKID